MNYWYKGMKRPIMRKGSKGVLGEQMDGVPAGGTEAENRQRCSADQPARPKTGPDIGGQRKYPALYG